MIKIDLRRIDWLTVFLVLGTWALVVVTLISTCRTTSIMQSEVTELKRATQLSWRPFLEVGLDITAVDPLYCASSSADGEVVGKYIGAVSTRDLEYKLFRSLYLGVSQSLLLRNSGSTPLKLKRELISTLSGPEWREALSASVMMLADTAFKWPEMTHRETDLIIAPGDSFRTKEKGYGRYFPLALFEAAVEEDGEFIVYPFSVLEYEDMFGNTYNSVIVRYLKLGAVISGDTVSIRNDGEVGLERIEWDVFTLKHH